MIIISDTTPLHYLILLGRAEILETLFGNIILPETVLAEMQHERAPEAVRSWVAALPTWIEVKKPSAKFLASVKKIRNKEKPKLSRLLSK